MRPLNRIDRSLIRQSGGVGQGATNADAPSPLQSRDLLLGGRIRAIEHADQRYYLRLTRNGKLILGK